MSRIMDHFGAHLDELERCFREGEGIVEVRTTSRPPAVMELKTVWHPIGV